ncbi:MFS transporter [Jatrophihabitans telluris]|uniref:MFS transporter n=1 Tax=Jatrophihabitans telluris TaxID=2038343 RepID=A0ABY4R0A1_9ACTN|nr:MFS transporter [Jatrophihabitans telluris]UQX89140.1 MFS transporter [Jatrophihabitans telluris]
MVSSQTEWIARAHRELRRNRLGASVAFAAQGLMFAVLLTHVPQFKHRFAMDDNGIALVILTVSLLAGAGSLSAESLARRFSSRFTLQIALVWIGLAALGIALAGSRPTFLLAFGIYGFGLGAVDAGTNMQAVAVQGRYGRVILTSFHAWWSAGGIVGALYVAGTERLGLGLGWSVALAALLVTGYGLVSSTVLLRADRGLGTGPIEHRIPWRPVLLLGAAMVCFYVVDAGAGSWATTYAHDSLHASSSLAPVAYAAYQATALLSRVFGDLAVRRFGVQPTVRVAAAMGVTGLIVAIAAPNPWVVIAGFGITGIGLPVVAPLCFSACGTLAPGHADQVVARVNIFNYLGSIIGGVSVGAIGGIGSLRWGFVVPAVLAAGLLWLAPAFEPDPVEAT